MGFAFCVMTPPPLDMIPYEREALEAERSRSSCSHTTTDLVANTCRKHGPP